MPRRVDPKWRKTGVARVSRIHQQDADRFRPLLNLVTDRKGVSENELLARLLWIKQKYSTWQVSGANVATRAEARKALQELAAMDPIPHCALDALNGRAASELFDQCISAQLPYSHDSQPSIWWLWDGPEDLTALRPVIIQCIERLKSTRGADGNGDVYWAVGTLCGLYEEVTGNRVTLSNKGSDRQYRSAPSGTGTQFVFAAMKLIDPAVTESTGSGVIRRFITSRGEQAR